MDRRDVYERGAVAAFFVTLVVVGVVLYDDYGMSWDEPGLVHYGNLLLEHYAPGGEWETYSNLRFYGPVGPVALALADRLTEGPAYPVGHLVNYVFFLVCAGAFYALCRYQFRSRTWGLLGAAMLVLSPRIFSHAFVNPKDLPLMTMFVVTVYTLVRFLDSRERRWIVLCGVATATAMAVRVTGAYLIVLALGAMAADALARRDRGEVRRDAVSAALFVAIALAGTVAMWPFLWENPVVRFYESATLMSNFVDGPQVMFQLGRVTPVTDLPWHYLLVWIGVTTPPLYLGLSLVGLAALPWRARAFVERERDRFLFLYFVWGFVPLIAVAVLRPPLYDEWRQALFVYPAILLVAVAGARRVAGKVAASSLRRPLAIAAGGLLACTLFWAFATTVRLHPYQAAYFNVFAGDEPQLGFDVDYWGVSYLEGMDRLLNLEQGQVDLYVCSGPGPEIASMLEPERAARLHFVGSVEEARYTLCAPRASSGGWIPQGDALFTIERDGVPLLFAHRR